MFELMPCLLAGSPFTDPTGPLPASGAHNLKVRDHAGNDLFATPLTPFTWHNFAVQVDWDNLTLGVFYSSNDAKLTAVTDVLQNPTASLGAAGQGDFHFGVLKVCRSDELGRRAFSHAYNTKSCRWST